VFSVFSFHFVFCFIRFVLAFGLRIDVFLLTFGLRRVFFFIFIFIFFIMNKKAGIGNQCNFSP
jgi:hypothetical protein